MSIQPLFSCPTAIEWMQPFLLQYHFCHLTHHTKVYTFLLWISGWGNPSNTCTAPQLVFLVVSFSALHLSGTDMCINSVDDYLLWPQHYLKEYPYLAAILAKPTDPNNPLSCMLWDVTSDDFVPSSGNVTTGLGHLSQSKFQGFKKLQNELKIRVLEHKATKKHPHIAVTAIDRSMCHVSEWLDNLPAMLNQIRYFVTAFQCYFLELCGVLDYLEIYEPCINGLLPSTTVTANTIGAFTSNACVVQDFFITGLPIFFICPAYLFKTPGYFYIQNMVPVQEPQYLYFSMLASIPHCIQWWDHWPLQIWSHTPFYTFMAGVARVV